MQNQTSKLVGMALSIGLSVLPINSSVKADYGHNEKSQNPSQEIKELTLYEQVGKFLNQDGLGKEIDRITQYLFISNDDQLFYNRRYDFNGEPYIEQYLVTDISQKNRTGGEILHIKPFPLYILWRGRVYSNPMGGIDGIDEILLENEVPIESSPRENVRLKGESI